MRKASAVDDDREARAANLFDIRRIIGGLFLVYGVILVVLGLGASDQDVHRAHGINVNLSVGISLLVISACFIGWALLRPLGRELEDDDDAPSDEGERFVKGARDSLRNRWKSTSNR
jgi:hypothetical protein